MSIKSKILFFYALNAAVFAESDCLDLGNFALSVSQQPGPLVGFGQTVIDKGQVQLYLFADAFVGNDSYATDLQPYLVYGVTDSFSLFFNFPFSPGNKAGNSHSSGFQDFYLQAECAVYSTENNLSSMQATLVGQVVFPIGSATKKPPTGFGSPSFFMGSTFNYTGRKWFGFFSPGGLLTTSRHGTKFGDQFIYQMGIGRNIPSPCGWIFACMLEVDGQLSWDNSKAKSQVPDSASNVIYATPSLWFSSEHLIIQWGVGYPIVQSIGNQDRNFISTDFQIAYTF